MRRMFIIIIVCISFLSVIGYYVYPQVSPGKKLNIFERMWLGVEFDEEELVNHALDQIFDILPGLENEDPDLLNSDNIRKIKVTYEDARSSKDDGVMVIAVVDIYLYEPADAEYGGWIAVDILTWRNWASNLSTDLMDYYQIER